MRRIIIASCLIVWTFSGAVAANGAPIYQDKPTKTERLTSFNACLAQLEAMRKKLPGSQTMNASESTSTTYSSFTVMIKSPPIERTAKTAARFEHSEARISDDGEVGQVVTHTCAGRILTITTKAVKTVYGPPPMQ